MDKELLSKLKHDLQEISYWMATVSEGLSKENVDGDIKILAKESSKRLNEVIDGLMREGD